jgi:hypothetical protein
VRKIAQRHISHNAPARWAVAGLLLVLGGATAGCQGHRLAAGKAAAHVAQRCALVVDTSGLDAFWVAADQIQSAPEIPSAAIGADLAALPVWRRWCQSYAPEVVSADLLGLTVRAATLGLDRLTPVEAGKLPRRDVVRCQAFTLAQRARVQEFVRTFMAEESACAVWPLARAWVRPEALPDTLRIDLLAGNAEIRLFEGHFLVDAGLALACGPKQMSRFLASTLYRKLEATEERSPGEVQGEAVLAQTLRLVRNEGVAAYIDDLPNLYFSKEHPALAGSAPVPEDVCATARLNLLYVEQVVTRQLALPAATRDFTDVHLNFVGSRGWQATGWFMATVIARRLGEPRLQAAARSLSGFLAAYHEAAAMNPPAAAAAPGSVDQFVATAPVFSAPVFAVLQHSLGGTP